MSTNKSKRESNEKDEFIKYIFHKYSEIRQRSLSRSKKSFIISFPKLLLWIETQISLFSRQLNF